jgi:hypothetical protein
MLNQPSAVATDPAGNVYIADAGNLRIRKVSAEERIITTIAGTGNPGYNGDGIPATSANITTPRALAADAAGNVFIYEASTARVRRVDASTGLISTYAGNGTIGWSGDGGPATGASLSNVDGLTVTPNGDLYISDAGNRRLRRVANDTGFITTVLGNGTAWFCGNSTPRRGSCIDTPQGIAVNAQGVVYISDSGNGRIRKVDPGSGLLTTIAGSGAFAGHSGDGGPAINASFGAEPQGLALDSLGNLYIAGGLDHRVRRIDASTGTITTIAGNGAAGYSGDGGSALLASFDNPTDLVVDAAGNVYVSDSNNHRVRRIDAASGVISTVAGSGLTTGELGDGGTATLARIVEPGSLAIDLSGNLLVVDDAQPRIRKVEIAAGLISTIAGDGTAQPTSRGDNGPAIDASLGVKPQIAVEPDGNILVTSQFWVRRIYIADGKIQRLNPTYGFMNVDGGGPQNVAAAALAPGGALYIADAIENMVFRYPDLPALPPDSTPPVINPVLEGTLGLNGWYTSNVRVRFYIDESQSSREVTPGCFVATVSQDTPGTSFVCDTWSAGGATSATLTVKRDATRPTLVFGTPTPAPNASGSYSGDVTFPFTAADAMSGLATGSSGSVVVSGEGTGLTAQVTVTDLAGNSATFTTPPVTITHALPPVVSAQLSGSLGNNGWYRSDVQVSWSVDGNGSAITSSAGCDASNLTADTSGTTFTCTATSAGGTTTQSVTIKRDATAPSLAFGTKTPAPNSRGWNTTSVNVPFTTADLTSGVASTSSPSPVVISGNGAGLTVSVTVTDQAGNSASFTTVAVNIDNTVAVITPNITGTLGNNGWYRSNVQLTWTVDELPGSVEWTSGCGTYNVTSDTTGISYSCGVQSTGGYTSKTVSIKRDTTLPAVTITRPANGATYAVSQSVTSSFSCTDARLQSCAGTVANGAGIDTGTAGTKTFTVTGTDLAGNIRTVVRTYTVQ